MSSEVLPTCLMAVSLSLISFRTSPVYGTSAHTLAAIARVRLVVIELADDIAERSF